jgi:hypothetical protein
VIPALGARKLSADDVDYWLDDKAKTLSTSTLANLHSILKRSVALAQKRDKAKRNGVLLCDIPHGQEGRPSKSLTYDQAAFDIHSLGASRADLRSPFGRRPPKYIENASRRYSVGYSKNWAPSATVRGKKDDD